MMYAWCVCPAALVPSSHDIVPCFSIGPYRTAYAQCVRFFELFPHFLISFNPSLLCVGNETGIVSCMATSTSVGCVDPRNHEQFGTLSTGISLGHVLGISLDFENIRMQIGTGKQSSWIPYRASSRRREKRLFVLNQQQPNRKFCAFWNSGDLA